MASNRRAGIIQIIMNGKKLEAQGEWEYNLGVPERDGMIGADGLPQGFTEKGTIPYIQGKLTDSSTLDLKTLQGIDDATISLILANGKTIMLHNGWHCNKGANRTNMAELDTRFEGLSAEELRPVA